MTAVTKFMFDTEFDPRINRKTDPAADSSLSDVDPDGAMGVEENEDEEEEVLPGYSEAQLEEAKAESFEAGKLEGAREAASTIEKETLMTVQAISLQVTDLFGRQELANSVLLRDGIGIAATIARKLFPAMNEQNALGEIDRLVEHTLLRLIEEPRVVIRVNPELMEPLGGRLNDLKAGAGYEGRIVMKEDSSLVYGDCRMEWGDGSAERNVDSLWQSIDQIIEGNLGTGQKREANQGAVELSPPRTPESEPADNAENDAPPQVEDVADEENHKESAPPGVTGGESMEPGEDNGIVGPASGGDEASDIDSTQVDDTVETDDPNSPPDEPASSAEDDE